MVDHEIDEKNCLMIKFVDLINCTNCQLKSNIIQLSMSFQFTDDHHDAPS